LRRAYKRRALIGRLRADASLKMRCVMITLVISVKVKSKQIFIYFSIV